MAKAKTMAVAERRPSINWIQTLTCLTSLRFMERVNYPMAMVRQVAGSWRATSEAKTDGPPW